jgi:hypothetical protein
MLRDFYKAFNHSEHPSENNAEYWLSHYSQDVTYEQHTSNGGKWLIPVSKESVDRIWKKIKNAQDKGTLGDMSKVSTRLNAAMKGHDSYIICVYTYDSTDMNDVIRVRKGLRKLGFKDPLNYKRDKETIAGVYGTPDEFFMTL